MPDTEIEGTVSETPVEGATPEQNAVSLDNLVSVLTSEQLQSLIAAVPEDTLRQMARNQEHPLGKITQSESDRRMESWRQTQLRTQAENQAAAHRANRQRFLETAPDDEVAARVRDEARFSTIEENVRYNQYVAMFNELKPAIEALPPERRARVTEFVQSPNAEAQWYKLPTLVMEQHNEHQRELVNKQRESERETSEARQVANAVTKAPPTDVGKGAVVSGGSAATGDGARDDVRTVAQRLHEAGVKVPFVFLKAN